MNSLDSIYNKGTDHLTFVRSTDDVVTRLFDQFAWAEIVLRWVAYLVAVVAAGGVLASIYNSMNERRREFAILRALGAGRNVVFSIIVLESAVISAIGSVIGFGVYALIMVAAGSTLLGEIGVTLRLLEFHPIMVVVQPDSLCWEQWWVSFRHSRPIAPMWWKTSFRRLNWS